MDQLCFIYGGRCAEELFFGKVFNNHNIYDDIDIDIDMNIRLRLVHLMTFREHMIWHTIWSPSTECQIKWDTDTLKKEE